MFIFLKPNPHCIYLFVCNITFFNEMLSIIIYLFQHSEKIMFLPSKLKNLTFF